MFLRLDSVPAQEGWKYIRGKKKKICGSHNNQGLIIKSGNYIPITNWNITEQKGLEWIIHFFLHLLINLVWINIIKWEPKHPEGNGTACTWKKSAFCWTPLKNLHKRNQESDSQIRYSTKHSRKELSCCLSSRAAQTELFQGSKFPRSFLLQPLPTLQRHSPDTRAAFKGLEVQLIILNWKHGAFPALSVQPGLTMVPSELALWESCPCRPGHFPCPAGAGLSPRPAAAQPRLTLCRSCKQIDLPASHGEKVGMAPERR